MFKESLYFRYVQGRDLINTELNDSGGWNYNYNLMGSTRSSTNSIKLNSYNSLDGGNWKSYVFLAEKPDPLTFTPNQNLNKINFFIPGLQKV